MQDQKDKTEWAWTETKKSNLHAKESEKVEKLQYLLYIAAQ